MSRTATINRFTTGVNSDAAEEIVAKDSLSV